MPRTPRSAETREETARVRQWKPPQKLPTPNKKDGYTYRYIRTATLGKPDVSNVLAKFREGYEVVPRSEHPELEIIADEGSRYKEGIEIGGQLLCRIPDEMVEQRKAHFAAINAAQMQSVNEQLDRASDSRMPLERASRTHVTFGSGNTPE